MTSITASGLLTIIYVLVDDWYQTQGIQYLKGKPGAKPQSRSLSREKLVQNYPISFPLKM